MRPNVVFVATYDTKGAESDYIKKQVEENGAACTTIDVGVGGAPAGTPDISLEELCRGSAHTVAAIHAMPRGDAVKAASDLLEERIARMYESGEMSAIIGIGGAGGTQIVTQAMRTLPFGIPKLMLSTLASGNTRWYIEDSDISIMPSVSDVAGLNCVTETVFSRFAALSAKAAQWYAESRDEFLARFADKGTLRIGMTMYGTTTKGVTYAREALEAGGFETIVFHASGAGGRSMEGFVRQGAIHGVLDMTLAEIGAHLVGGLHNAGPHRLEAAVEKGIPLLLVPGAADTVVLPPMSDLPEHFRNGRVLNYHNPTMTTMRTNVDENVQIGSFIVSKLRGATGPAKVLIPTGGLSSIDRPGEKFYMPEANEALFRTLREGLAGTAVEVIEDSRHIYDDGFGQRAAAMMEEMMLAHYR